MHFCRKRFLKSMFPYTNDGLAYSFWSKYIFIVTAIVRSLIQRETSIKIVMRKSRRVSLQKFSPENVVDLYARVSTCSPSTFSRILSTPRTKHSSTRYPPLPTRELSASLFLRLSTRLLSSYLRLCPPCPIWLLPWIRIFRGLGLACSHVCTKEW